MDICDGNPRSHSILEIRLHSVSARGLASFNKSYQCLLFGTGPGAHGSYFNVFPSVNQETAGVTKAKFFHYEDKAVIGGDWKVAFKPALGGPGESNLRVYPTGVCMRILAFVVIPVWQPIEPGLIFPILQRIRCKRHGVLIRVGSK